MKSNNIYFFVQHHKKYKLIKLPITLLKNLDNYTKMEYTSRMSSALAHEIKNPLAGIRSGIQVLGGRAVKENEKLLCDSMLHEIDRVTGLINDLFTLSVKKDNNRHVFPAVSSKVRSFTSFFCFGRAAFAASSLSAAFSDPFTFWIGILIFHCTFCLLV